MKKNKLLITLFLACTLIYSAKTHAQVPNFMVPLPVAPESLPNTQPETLPHVPDIILPYYLLKGATYPISLLGNWIDGDPNKQKDQNPGAKKTGRKYYIYPAIAFADGGRFGGGFGFAHPDLFNKNYILSVNALVFTDLDVRGKVIVGKRDIFRIKNQRVSFLAGADWFMDSMEDYFGIGPNTEKSDKGEFSSRQLRVGGTLGFDLPQNLNIAPHIALDWGKSSYKDIGSTPSVQDVFPASELAGFNSTIAYADFGFRFAHDTRDNIYYTQKGGVRSFIFQYMKGLNHKGFDYLVWRIKAEQYLPLGYKGLVLWLNNSWTFAESPSENQIPFYRLPAIDLFAPVRGFIRGRFRDKSSVVANAEFRYPLWDNIDGTVFADTGRVFNGIEHFSFNDFQYSVGGGVRITLKKYYIFKVELGYGGEGPNTVFEVIQQF